MVRKVVGAIPPKLEMKVGSTNWGLWRVLTNASQQNGTPSEAHPTGKKRNFPGGSLVAIFHVAPGAFSLTKVEAVFRKRAGIPRVGENYFGVEDLTDKLHALSNTNSLYIKDMWVARTHILGVEKQGYPKGIHSRLQEAQKDFNKWREGGAVGKAPSLRVFDFSDWGGWFLANLKEIK